MHNKTKSAMAAALAACLLSTTVLAQPRSGDGHREGHSGQPQASQQQHRNSDAKNAGPGRGSAPAHADRGRRADPPARQWARGDRVPQPYRGHQYVIDDWRAHHLSAPPRGYHWIGVGADYFLIGVATGVVMQAILGR